jgi:inhibitor of cysteine peptidase
MVTQRILILLLLLLTAVTTSCRQLTETDPAQPLAVTAGDEFDIVIEANPTTGYEWRLTEELDEAIVQLVGQEYEADRPINEGSGGLDIWTFQAIAPGEAAITLGHFPPDGSDVPNETAVYTVVVK